MCSRSFMFLRIIVVQWASINHISLSLRILLITEVSSTVAFWSRHFFFLFTTEWKRGWGVIFLLAAVRDWVGKTFDLCLILRSLLTECKWLTTADDISRGILSNFFASLPNFDNSLSITVCSFILCCLLGSPFYQKEEMIACWS